MDNYLWLDCVFVRAVVIKPLDIQFTIEVTNIADDGVFQHSREHVALDNVFTTGGGDEDSGLLQSIFNRRHLVACSTTTAHT